MFLPFILTIVIVGIIVMIFSSIILMSNWKYYKKIYDTLLEKEWDLNNVNFGYV